MEINPQHELIKKLNNVRKAEPKVAALVVRQLLDNALITAGNI